MKDFLNRDYIENFIRYHKKTIIKVVAGFVLFVTAFFVFCIRDDGENVNKFELVNGLDYDIQSQNKITESVTSSSIKHEEKIDEPQKIYVDITGAVENPYVYEMEEGARVYQAIELAGGLKEDADISNINLAQVLRDEDKIIIYSKSQVNNGSAKESININCSSVTSNLKENNKDKDRDNIACDKLININTATNIELQNIVGIGPSTAEKIITYREAHGNFKKIEDIMNVNGIGEKTFIKLKNNIMV